MSLLKSAAQALIIKNWYRSNKVQSILIYIGLLLDINECEFANGGCQDVCTNSEGSFYCSCSGNRELSEDGFSCFGGKQMDHKRCSRLRIWLAL
jgi:hypothetical protein